MKPRKVKELELSCQGRLIPKLLYSLLRSSFTDFPVQGRGTILFCYQLTNKTTKFRGGEGKKTCSKTYLKTWAFLSRSLFGEKWIFCYRLQFKLADLEGRKCLGKK